MYKTEMFPCEGNRPGHRQSGQTAAAAAAQRADVQNAVHTLHLVQHLRLSAQVGHRQVEEREEGHACVAADRRAQGESSHGCEPLARQQNSFVSTATCLLLTMWSFNRTILYMQLKSRYGHHT